MTVTIAGQNITSHIVAGQYQINQSDVFEEWTDANGRTHRNVYRTRVSGSFDVFFRELSDYSAFVNACKNARNTAGVIPCSVFVNNTSETKQIEAYVTFAPSLDIDGTLQDYVPQFEITIQEY